MIGSVRFGNRRAALGTVGAGAKGVLTNGAAIAIVILVALFVVYASFDSSVLTSSGFTYLIVAITPLALAAVGETLVVLTGGLDMSAGAILGLANTFAAFSMHDGLASILLVCVLTLLVGAAAGMANGVCVAYGRLQPVVATLATSFMWFGVSILLMPQPGGHIALGWSLTVSGAIGGVFPWAGLLLLAVIAGWLVLKRTRLGINLYAVGSDESAAATTGVRTQQVKLRAYALAGVLYALGGLFLAGVMTSGDSGIGAAYLLPVVAAVVIGGTTLAGGRGGVIGSLVGAAILTILTNVLFVLGVSSFYTDIFQGVIIILAVMAGVLGSAAGRRLRSQRRARTDDGNE